MIRKNIRLPENDYTAGAYFVTVCSIDRKNLFRSVGADIIRPWELTKCGKIIETAITAISDIYPNVLVDKYVIMPNHIHMILIFNDTPHGRILSAPTLSTVIGQMKRWCTKQFGAPIWQKSFYEHGIRTRNDYLEIWQYIDTNPAKWADDCYHET